MTDLKFDLLSRMYKLTMDLFIDEVNLLNNYSNSASPLGDVNDAKRALEQMITQRYVHRRSPTSCQITAEGIEAYEAAIAERINRADALARHNAERAEDLDIHAKERAEDLKNMKIANYCSFTAIGISVISAAAAVASVIVAVLMASQA